LGVVGVVEGKRIDTGWRKRERASTKKKKRKEKRKREKGSVQGESVTP